MTNAVGLLIFIVGIVLLIFGLNESQSLGAEIARLFGGQFGERPVWLVLGGGLAVLAGLLVAMAGKNRSTE